MNFSILTLFPEAYQSYLNVSILKRAQEKKLVDFRFVNIRDFSADKHRTVDDKPYGGGAGMVLMAEPILRAFDSLGKPSGKRQVILLSAKGKQFNQKLAYAWARQADEIVFINGRYEGIDERVRKVLKADEISIGPYVLTDGDAASLVMISAVARLIPGVIRLESLEEESHWNLLLQKETTSKQKGLEYPHYSRPEVLEWKGKKYRVPKILLSGDHKKIALWRRSQSK